MSTPRPRRSAPRPRRSVIEMMILVFTFVVAFSILATGALVAYITVTEPTRDVSNIMDKVFALLTGIVGALLGLLAGRSEAAHKDES